MTSAVRSALLALGSLIAALGATMTAQPFSSLDVLSFLAALGLATMALGTLLGSPRPWTWPTRAATVVWLTGAIIVATQPQLGIRDLAIVLGTAVMVEGVLRAAEAIRGTPAHQLATLSFGLSGTVLGVLTLATPRASVGSVAVLFGIRAVWFGITVFWTGVRGTFDEHEPFEPGSIRRVTTGVASAVALVLAATLGGVSYWFHEGRPDRLGELSIPTEVPREPGKLISAEEFNTGVPAGARAWRILYTTTRNDRQPALATGLIIAGEDAPSGPRPVLAWAHGTTGIAESCAPSTNPTSATFATIPGLTKALDQGWVVVATDYIGLGTPGPHPYLIGQGEGRSVLDSVRAAHEFAELDLSEKTAVWGHSQGGGAALWTGTIAPTYAPEIEIVGVAGIAPASDLTGLVNTIMSNPFGTLFAAYVVDAYSAAYPDVAFDDYVTAGARSVIRQAAGLCIRETSALAALAQDPAFQTQIYATSLTTGPLARRLQQNTPLDPIQAPTLILQGEDDPLVVPTVQASYAAERCAISGGGPLDYRTYPERDHLTIINPGSAMIPDLLGWTADRFAGKPAASTC